MSVFIVQDQKCVDSKGVLKPKFDFSEAAKFGEIKYLLKPGASPFDLPPVLDRLHEVLCNFSDNDYLVLTGNPVLLTLAGSIAAFYNNGSVKLLQWSGAKNDYIPVHGKDIFYENN